MKSPFAFPQPVRLPGPGPHLGYVGTLHSARLDAPLISDLAEATPGTVHLVGLDEVARAALTGHPHIVGHGLAPAAEVPGWMRPMHVLLCTHWVDAFTLSLDANKSHEELAASRRIVATPASGLQLLSGEGISVVGQT